MAIPLKNGTKLYPQYNGRGIMKNKTVISVIQTLWKIRDMESDIKLDFKGLLL